MGGPAVSPSSAGRWISWWRHESSRRWSLLPWRSACKWRPMWKPSGGRCPSSGRTGENARSMRWSVPLANIRPSNPTTAS